MSIHYTAKLNNGETIETTREKTPLDVKIGSKRLIAGLDEAIIGLKKGDKQKIKVPPSKGFGERRENLLQEIPKSKFGEEIKASKGEVVELRHDDGKRQLVTIHDIKNDLIILDLNHPLAGETLTFDVEIVDVSSN